MAAISPVPGFLLSPSSFSPPICLFSPPVFFSPPPTFGIPPSTPRSGIIGDRAHVRTFTLTLTLTIAHSPSPSPSPIPTSPIPLPATRSDRPPIRHRIIALAPTLTTLIRAEPTIPFLPLHSLLHLLLLLVLQLLRPLLILLPPLPSPPPQPDAEDECQYPSETDAEELPPIEVGRAFSFGEDGFRAGGGFGR